MTKRLYFVLIACLLGAGLTLAACDDEETTPTDTPDADTEDVGAPDADLTGDGGGDGGEVWADHLHRVTFVNVTRPSGVGTILTGIIRPELELGNIHILIGMTDFADETGETTFMMRGDAGDIDEDGEYIFIGTSDAAESTIEANGDFANDVEARIDFPVRFALDATCLGNDCPDGCRTNDDCREDFACDAEGDGRCFQQVILPLHDVLIDGTLEFGDDGFEINAASLTGMIMKTDADVTEIDLGGNVAILSDVLGGDATMDCPEDEDDKTGWCLGAQINASQVNH